MLNIAWTFQEFSVIQILREINFGDSRSAKSIILMHFEAPNCAFYEFLHILKAKITKWATFRAPKMAKIAFLELLQSPELVSRRI